MGTKYNFLKPQTVVVHNLFIGRNRIYYCNFQCHLITTACRNQLLFDSLTIDGKWLFHSLFRISKNKFLNVKTVQCQLLVFKIKELESEWFSQKWSIFFFKNVTKIILFLRYYVFNFKSYIYIESKRWTIRNYTWRFS